jgi:hypothetical protein
VLAFFIVLSSYLLGTPENPEKVSSVAYFPALVAALISGEFMIRHLKTKPVLPKTTESDMPGLA